MKTAALLVLGLGLAACNRERTWSPPPPDAGSPERDRTWVAQPGDLDAEQVRIVQRALGDRGFQVELTGKYDDDTRSAVAEFQRARGLPRTGNVNADTAAALGVDPADVIPVRGTTPTGTDGAKAPVPTVKPPPEPDVPADPPASKP